MTITRTKLAEKIHQAQVSYFVAGRMVCDLLCKTALNFDVDYNEVEKLMDECSEAERVLQGRYEALQDLSDELWKEEHHYEFTLRRRMYDSLQKYRKLSARLDAETEKRRTA